jgi:hypothetical protein
MQSKMETEPPFAPHLSSGLVNGNEQQTQLTVTQDASVSFIDSFVVLDADGCISFDSDADVNDV